MAFWTGGWVIPLMRQPLVSAMAPAPPNMNHAKFHFSVLLLLFYDLGIVYNSSKEYDRHSNTMDNASRNYSPDVLSESQRIILRIELRADNKYIDDSIQPQTSYAFAICTVSVSIEQGQYAARVPARLPTPHPRWSLSP